MKPSSNVGEKVRCHLCGADGADLVTVVTAKPARENEFGIPAAEYRRPVYRCRACSVHFNWHGFIGENFYGGTYNQAVYSHRLFEKYKQIMALPEEKSDNRQRVKRIAQVCREAGWKPAETSVLDVGSGLCVFLGAMKESGFRSHCIDPDPEAVRHAIENVRIDGGFAGTLDGFPPGPRFDVITFNKVLEHVKDAIGTLALAKKYLTPRGLVYVELPDAEGALKNGSAVDREEFYIEHFTVFDEKSFRYLAQKAGFQILQIKSIHEPSDKYTIYAFLRPA